MDGSAFRGLGEALQLGFVIGAVAVVLVPVLAAYIALGHFNAPDWQDEAIERGFALYCPSDGKFAWKGECADDQ